MTDPYYQDEYVTLYHGDCREVLPEVGGADLLLTDPPYGIDYQHGARAGGVKLGMDGESIEGDGEPFDPSHLLHLSDKTILWGGNHYASRLPDSRGWMIWDKREDGPVMDQSDAELAWTSFMATARIFSRRWSGNHRGGREQREGRCHVNQKPVALMRWCIEKADEPTSVLDPYAGSGSTLIAAKECGITSVGIEIEERYCEVAAERLSQQVLAL